MFFKRNDFILLAGGKKKKKQVFPMAKGSSYTAVVPYNLIFNWKKPNHRLSRVLNMSLL